MNDFIVVTSIFYYSTHSHSDCIECRKRSMGSEKRKHLIRTCDIKKIEEINQGCEIYFNNEHDSLYVTDKIEDIAFKIKNYGGTYGLLSSCSVERALASEEEVE